MPRPLGGWVVSDSAGRARVGGWGWAGRSVAQLVPSALKLVGCSAEPLCSGPCAGPFRPCGRMLLPGRVDDDEPSEVRPPAVLGPLHVGLGLQRGFSRQISTASSTTRRLSVGGSFSRSVSMDEPWNDPQGEYMDENTPSWRSNTGRAWEAPEGQLPGFLKELGLGIACRSTVWSEGRPEVRSETGLQGARLRGALVVVDPRRPGVAAHGECGLSYQLPPPSLSAWPPAAARARVDPRSNPQRQPPRGNRLDQRSPSRSKPEPPVASLLNRSKCRAQC